MAKQILLAHGKKGKLMKLTKSSYPTVREALHFRSDTQMARRIRKMALKELGGKQVEY